MIDSASIRVAPKNYCRDFFWVAALAGVLLLLLHESIFSGKGLVPADGILNLPPWNQTNTPSNALLIDQYGVLLPMQEFAHQQKHFPLWNPDLGCGMPNIGVISAALLFPIRLVLSPLDPFTASGPAAFLKLFLAGWFTMLYVRLLGTSRPAAFLAGIVFSLSGFMIVWLGSTHVNSAMWLPLLLYFVEKSFRSGEASSGIGPVLRAWAGFSIAFACMILGGHPPTAIQISLVVAIYFLFRLAEHRHAGISRPVVMLGCAVIVGLLLAAPQILPYLEYYRQSSSALSSAALARWSSHLGIGALIHFLLPNALGNPAVGFVDLPRLLGWIVTDNYNERTGYVGIVPLFLAVCAVACWRCRFTKFFFWLGIGCMLVIWGVPPFPWIARALPILQYVNQTRLLLVVGFSVAVLAALGLDALVSRSFPRRTVLAAVGFCALAVLLPISCWILYGPEFDALDAAHKAFLRRQLYIFCAGIAFVIVAARLSNARAGWLAASLCVGCTVVDLLLFATGYNPAISRDRYYPTTPAIEWLQKEPGVFRIMGGGVTLRPDSAEVYGLQDARGRDFMSVRRYEELITGTAGDFYFYRDVDALPRTFSLLNVKYILSATPLNLNPRLYEPVYQKEISIYRYNQAVERAFAVFNYQVEPNQDSLLAAVSSKEFDPRRNLLLEEQPTLAQTAADAANAVTNAMGSTRILSYEADDVKIEATLSRPGFVVLLDTWFPGWTATVNGAPERILRADYNFRAVALPAGKSTVDFSYRPNSLRLGIYLFMMGAAILAGVFFIAWKKHGACFGKRELA